MNENENTDLLVKGLLGRSPATVVDRFAAEVCGLRDGLGEVRRFETQQRLSDLPGTTRGLVVGLAPTASLDISSTNIGGDAVVDGVVAGDTVLLLENKIAGSLPWDQLVRHALHWSLAVDREEPMWGPDAIPPGYALTTWATIGGWLARERSIGEASAAELEQLIAEVERRRLATLDPNVLAGEAATPVALESAPEPVNLRELSTAWDYRRIREGCEDLFARSPVNSGDCLGDTERMRATFEAAGLSAPCGLRYTHRDGAMTPLRVLDTLYRGKGRLTDAYPAQWTAARMRMTDHGADQAVLLAMLAWAGATKREAARKNIFATVPLIWSLTPERSPGLEALHQVVDTARR